MLIIMIFFNYNILSVKGVRVQVFFNMSCWCSNYLHRLVPLIISFTDLWAGIIVVRPGFELGPVYVTINLTTINVIVLG